MELTNQGNVEELDFEIPKLKSNNNITDIKRAYQSDLDKVVDIGVSSITIEEAIDELSKHLNSDNSVNVNNGTKPFSLVVADLVHHAKKSYNLIVIDKMRIRNHGNSSFTLEDIATSINPKFSLENMYVRFFIEYLESQLSRCLDDEELNNLTERVLNKQCKEVIAEVNALLSKYKNELSIYNDINHEFSRPIKGGRI